MAITRPGIPAIDQKIETPVRRVLMAMKENIEISNGIRAGTSADDQAWKRRSVTLDMLIKLNVITEQEARSVWQEP